MDRIKSYSDKLERKVKEVVEQNVSIKILVESLKTKQIYQERTLSQISEMIN